MLTRAEYKNAQGKAAEMIQNAGDDELTVDELVNTVSGGKPVSSFRDRLSRESGKQHDLQS